jgi:hypothetical protein
MTTATAKAIRRYEDYDAGFRQHKDYGSRPDRVVEKFASNLARLEEAVVAAPATDLTDLVRKIDWARKQIERSHDPELADAMLTVAAADLRRLIGE